MVYKTKPRVAHAMQWTGDNSDEVLCFLRDTLPYNATIRGVMQDNRRMDLKWFGDFYYMGIGDWVVFSPETCVLSTCDDRTFREYYRRA